jgi:benzodiazapine receptor
VAYLTIALAAVATAAISALLARSGMRWFLTLRLPEWPLLGRAMVACWGILFALTAVSAMLAWSGSSVEDRPRVAAVYAVDAFLNVAWCYLFFVRHQIGSAALEAALLAIATAVVVLEVFPVSLLAAALLVPFFVWVLHGMYLTLTIFRMNLKGRQRGGDA